MTKRKQGIIERAKAAASGNDNDARSKILKEISSNKYRFASAKTRRKVERLLAVA